MGEKPMVVASDQESDGTSVTVDSVNAAVDGWMVIHADKDGKLSQEELLKFGEEMGRRRMAEEGPDGDRPNDEGRSERPKRPE